MSKAWFSRSESLGSGVSETTRRTNSASGRRARRPEARWQAAKRQRSLVPLAGLLTDAELRKQQTESLLPMQCNLATVAAVLIQMEMRYHYGKRRVAKSDRGSYHFVHRFTTKVSGCSDMYVAWQPSCLL